MNIAPAGAVFAGSSSHYLRQCRERLMTDRASLEGIARSSSCTRPLGQRFFFGTPRFTISFSVIAGLVVVTVSRASRNSRSLTSLIYTRSHYLIRLRSLQIPTWPHIARASLTLVLFITILAGQSALANRYITPFLWQRPSQSECCL